MDKYLSVITNFGCHGRCPYCIVRENGIKVPKSTVDGLDKLEDAHYIDRSEYRIYLRRWRSALPV